MSAEDRQTNYLLSLTTAPLPPVRPWRVYCAYFLPVVSAFVPVRCAFCLCHPLSCLKNVVMSETFALFFACVFFCKFSFLRNLALFTKKSNLFLTFVYIFRIDSGEVSDRRCRAVGGSLSRGVKGTSLNNPATT